MARLLSGLLTLAVSLAGCGGFAGAAGDGQTGPWDGAGEAEASAAEDSAGKGGGRDGPDVASDPGSPADSGADGAGGLEADVSVDALSDPGPPVESGTDEGDGAAGSGGLEPDVSVDALSDPGPPVESGTDAVDGEDKCPKWPIAGKCPAECCAVQAGAIVDAVQKCKNFTPGMVDVVCYGGVPCLGSGTPYCFELALDDGGVLTFQGANPMGVDPKKLGLKPVDTMGCPFPDCPKDAGEGEP